MSLKNKALHVLIFLCLSNTVLAQETKESSAQEKNKKEVTDSYNTWSFGAGLSNVKIYGDFSSYARKGGIESYTNLGGYIYTNKMFNPILGLELKFDFGSLGAAGQGFNDEYAIKGIDETIYGNQILTMDGSKFGFELNGIVNLSNLWKLNSKRWNWSFIAGIGTNYLDVTLYDESEAPIIEYNSDSNTSSLYIDTSIDLKYRINKRIDIEFRRTFNVNYNDTFDAAISSKNNYETYISTHLGLVYKIGKKERNAVWATNEDIGDEKFQVVDSDQDGVIDEVDKDPETPKEAMVYGNGVAVDTDSDGIPDHLDKCPLLSGVEAYYGCPEDKDGDGVYDYDDVCPEIKGVESNLGCPKKETPDDITKRIFLLAKSIYFKTDSDQIKGDSYTILNEIANIMLQYPNTKFTIDGHTDNTAAASYNLYLSKKRAASVLNYLSDVGVRKERLYAVGYGLEKPTHSNKTAEGRKRNRRVEINYIQPESEKGKEIYDPEVNVTESLKVIQPQTAGLLEDSDQDGVADILDQELNTPVGALVYGNGVAIDTDKDGLQDYMDACPLQYGTTDNGCPEDGEVQPTNNKPIAINGVSLSIKDSDGDGVVDALDAENNTPTGSKVYGNGVAIDTDNDGIIDLNDNCPLIEGTIAGDGCPDNYTEEDPNSSNKFIIKDADGDGVMDALDMDNNTPFGAKVYGNGVAIDTDNDGVIDFNDACLLSQGPEEFEGCPQNIDLPAGGSNSITINDADGDGVIDSLDKEPNTPLDAKVYGNGVAVDTDGDNIQDHLDLCPLKYGSKDKDGCPISPDSDGDGVPNEYDKEPGTPFGVKVYGNGVAMDIDSDGTPDHKDACPLKPGPSAKGGCPDELAIDNQNNNTNVAAISLNDSDKDGVIDQFDAEPNTPTGARVYGNGVSVDSDNDGIPDHADSCPNESGTKALSGCAPAKKIVAETNTNNNKTQTISMIDSDGDGVMDQFDKDPNTPKGAQVYGNGIPIDSDRDGVADYKDKCPLKSGPVEQDGCPTEEKQLDWNDSDGDGVVNEFDKSPNTPANVSVYGNGIPVDSDRDGVPDYKDKCPLKQGPVKQDGCPNVERQMDWSDSDGDGVVNEFDKEPNTPANAKVYGNGVAVDTDNDEIPDHKDECPFKAGHVENNGCPKIEGGIKGNNVDTDKDGVIDLYDKEPNTPFGVKVYSNGVSLDSDKDNIPDYKDRCPLQKGLPENEGCPIEEDLDGDGVSDRDDLCPDVYGTAANNGCPDKNFDKGVYLRIEALAQNISFARKKNTLTTKTTEALDEILLIMKEYTATKFEIAVHTDNMHNEKYSLFLSKRRANAIMKYLVDGGIDEDRLSSEGYGESQPKYSNTTDAATSELNNRIEFNYKTE